MERGRSVSGVLTEDCSAEALASMSSSTSKMGDVTSLRALRPLSLLKVLDMVNAPRRVGRDGEAEECCSFEADILCWTRLCVGVLEPSVGVLRRTDGAKDVPNAVTFTGEKTGLPRSASELAEADADRSLNLTLLDTCGTASVEDVVCVREPVEDRPRTRLGRVECVDGSMCLGVTITCERCES